MNPYDKRAANRTRNVTLKDVARVSGVSVSTASKALNDRADVHPETRHAIKDVARRLGFRHNSLARGLISGRSGMVGLITDDLAGRFSIPILLGVEDAFGADRMSVFLTDTRGDPIREAFHLQTLLDRQVDGLIVVASRTDARRPIVTGVNVPTVYAYGPSTDPTDLSIIPDNYGAGQVLAEHFVSLGRRRLVWVPGDPSFQASSDRLNGFCDALATRQVDPALVLRGPAQWSEEWGRAAARSLLASDIAFDGVACASDQIARGFCERLREEGIQIPKDVAIASFDNWELYADSNNPPLTSVDFRLEELGRLAADRLAASIRGEVFSGVELHDFQLVERTSTVSE